MKSVDYDRQVIGNQLGTPGTPLKFYLPVYHNPWGAY